MNVVVEFPSAVVWRNLRNELEVIDTTDQECITVPARDRFTASAGPMKKILEQPRDMTTNQQSLDRQ